MYMLTAECSGCSLDSGSDVPRGSSAPQIAKLFSFTWTLGPVLCLGVHYIQTVTAICSVLTLTAISLER